MPADKSQFSHFSYFEKNTKKTGLPMNLHPINYTDRVPSKQTILYTNNTNNNSNQHQVQDEADERRNFTLLGQGLWWDFIVFTLHFLSYYLTTIALNHRAKSITNFDSFLPKSTFIDSFRLPTLFLEIFRAQLCQMSSDFDVLGSF